VPDEPDGTAHPAAIVGTFAETIGEGVALEVLALLALESFVLAFDEMVSGLGTPTNTETL
jgi:hypothetical protein